MPLMVYTFLKGAIAKHGRSVTTAEIEDLAREILPMCVDHVVHHLVELERKNLATKRWNKERRGFVWDIPKDYTTEELAEKFPNLYKHSLYYYTVAETLGERIPMKDVIKILYEISKGSEVKPSINKIRSKLKERLRT